MNWFCDYMLILWQEEFRNVWKMILESKLAM